MTAFGALILVDWHVSKPLDVKELGNGHVADPVALV